MARNSEQGSITQAGAVPSARAGFVRRCGTCESRWGSLWSAPPPPSCGRREFPGLGPAPARSDRKRIRLRGPRRRPAAQPARAPRAKPNRESARRGWSCPGLNHGRTRYRRGGSSTDGGMASIRRRSSGATCSILRFISHARIVLADGTACEAEVPWYEASGIGRKEFKIKRILE